VVKSVDFVVSMVQAQLLLVSAFSPLGAGFILLVLENWYPRWGIKKLAYLTSSMTLNDKSHLNEEYREIEPHYSTFAMSNTYRKICDLSYYNSGYKPHDTASRL